MEAKELRIGNFVTWVDEDNPFNAILTIIGITLGGLFVEWEFSVGINDNTDCDFGNVKPIPLTEEWLLIFGFDDFQKGDISYYIENNGEIVFKKSALDILYEYPIQYVHQLQNLYFTLTGEELTMKTNTK